MPVDAGSEPRRVRAADDQEVAVAAKRLEESAHADKKSLVAGMGWNLLLLTGRLLRKAAAALVRALMPAIRVI